MPPLYTNEVRILDIPGWRGDGLVHGFSTLELGSVGLTHAPDRNAVLAARGRFAAELGLDADSITTAGAVHGAEVARVDAPRALVEERDAMITDRPGIALFATFADCYPILLWDPEHHAIGLAHAGWRGTEARVAVQAVEAMTREFGTDPRRLRAAIGPGICGRCYEVGEEVASRFEARFSTRAPDSKFRLDLAAANRAQLEESGVQDIQVMGLCTKETDYLASHRRAPDGTRCGAIIALP